MVKRTAIKTKNKTTIITIKRDSSKNYKNQNKNKNNENDSNNNHNTEDHTKNYDSSHSS